VSWFDLAEHVKAKELKGTSAEKVRAQRSVNLFASWAEGNSLPFPIPPADRIEALERYTKSLDAALKNKDGSLNKEGQSAENWAIELMKRSTQPIATETTSVRGNVKPPEVDEDEMAKRGEEEEFDEQDEVDDADEGEGEEEDEAVEAPKRQRMNGRGRSQQPVIVLPAGSIPGRRQNRSEPRMTGAAKLFNKAANVTIDKRDERGKVVNVDEYSMSDIGDRSLREFIEEVVHPRFRNDGPVTEYIAYPTGKRSQGTEIRMEDDEVPGAPDPFGNVRQALSLFKDLKGEDEDDNGMRDLLKNKAQQSGDMQSVMMMMMMDRMFSKKSGSDEILKAILDRLDRSNQPPPAPPPAFPQMMMPPPQHESASTKLVEMAIAKMAQPPPSMFEQAKELATVRQLFAPDTGDTRVQALEREIARLNAQLTSGPSRKEGFEQSVEAFEKVSTLVKSLAPQLGGESGGGGIAGFLKGILTPDVGRAIAQAVSGAPNQQAAQQQQAQQQAPQPQQQQMQPAQPAQPVQQQQRDPNRPPNPVPQAVQEAAKAFALAQTPPVRAERFADYVFAMFLANDPFYQSFLNPVVEQLSKPEVGVEELKPARSLALRLIAELKPDWATPEFSDVCISALAAKAGSPIPETLVRTRGAWTLDFRGSVIMLADVAKVAGTIEPAKVAPQPAPQVEPLVPQTLPALAEDAPPAQPLSTAPPDRKLRSIELEPVETAAEVIAAQQAKPKAQPRR
jgi:hypothetical protein